MLRRRAQPPLCPLLHVSISIQLESLSGFPLPYYLSLTARRGSGRWYGDLRPPVLLTSLGYYGGMVTVRYVRTFIPLAECSHDPTLLYKLAYPTKYAKIDLTL